MSEHTTFEICDYIRRCLLLRAAESIVYDWSQDIKLSRITDAVSFIHRTANYRPVDPNDLTREEMTALGFCPWSDELEMLLIPLWLKPFLCEQFVAVSFDGKQFTCDTSTMDDDHRFGMLAYGVIPKK